MARLQFLLGAILGVPHVFALGQPRIVDGTPGDDRLPIVQGATAAAIVVDTNDFQGVARAAADLALDIERVSGLQPKIVNQSDIHGATAIFVGTIGKSALVDRLISEGKLDVSPIRGKWESYLVQTVNKPMPDVGRALIIAGSDKRGTIYGIYDLSEQIGVSPWYWWADVPVRHKDSLFVKAGRYVQGPPAVKYRGIFLNDEAPCLTGWVKEKYGGYNHAFYTNVFELLLRLKANYLWPAMWDNCFNEDDPLNPKLADEYGIVMGTSHVEPMMRADKEWNRKGFSASQWNYDKNPEKLTEFWKEGTERNKPYENLITIAMRGKVDTPMSPTANIALLERIVTDQRKIIDEVYHTNAVAVPQLWALYKEVQQYYEKGMRVPDDVTLLWCDDNWGNVRRLPTPEERNRAGGAGIYYHFDYVGGPRNYKWLNTNPIIKVWEQMNLAYQYGADRVWVVNVGDLKPMEFPIEFFLSMAWDPSRWSGFDTPEAGSAGNRSQSLQRFTQLWAEREFGPERPAEIADIMSKYTKYNGRRKPELLDPTTFSQVNYEEADTVLADWKAITRKAEEIYNTLPDNARDAFYELVLFPTKACCVVNDLYITVAKNRLYASQGRASANDLAAQARALFKEDAELAAYYNRTLARGKWSHMMDQTHIGYTSWQQPRVDKMPNVTEIDPPANAKLGVAVPGSTTDWPGESNEPPHLKLDAFSLQRLYIDVFNRGRSPFEFSAKPSESWIIVSQSRGTITNGLRVWVSADWSKAPEGQSHGVLTVKGASDDVQVNVDVFNSRKEASAVRASAFVEADGCVSIEAEHYAKSVPANSACWERIPDYGRTLSGMSIFPVTAASVTPPQNSPCLEYQVYLFTTGMVDVASIIAPTLNYLPGRGLQFAVSFDDEPPQILTSIPKGYFVDNGVRDWEESVRNNSRLIWSTHEIRAPGLHKLKFWMVDPGVVLEKIVIDTGGAKPCYLGPPESYRAGTTTSSGTL